MVVKIIIFGPPAVGKSTMLGTVATIVSNGGICQGTFNTCSSFLHMSEEQQGVHRHICTNPESITGRCGFEISDWQECPYTKGTRCIRQKVLKWNVVDLEAFFVPESEDPDIQSLYNNVIEHVQGYTIIGGGAYNPRKCIEKYIVQQQQNTDFDLIAAFYLPDETKYRHVYDHKMISRGVGDDDFHIWQGAIGVYHSMMKTYKHYTRLGRSVIRIKSIAGLLEAMGSVDAGRLMKREFREQ